VPAEMQAIFKSSVASLIKNKSPNIVYDERSLIVKKIVESELAPIIDNVMKVFPEVYIKSHPRGGEKTVTIELHFSTYDKSKEVVEKRLQESVNLITSFIEKLGGIIEK
jgi:molybdopterin-biosynthesis enzyme MoeA-like protein